MYFKNKVSWNDKVFLVIIAVVIGALVEVCHGYFTTTRQADVYDALANAIGCVLGITIAGFLFGKYYSAE